MTSEATIAAIPVGDNAAHLREGFDMNKGLCLVCDEHSAFTWTDYNGQVYCRRCGATYQTISVKLKDEYLREIGLEAKDVKLPYCDVAREIPMLREYWAEHHMMVPLGCFVGRNPCTEDQRKTFDLWLYENRDRLRPQFDDAFYWDEIIKRHESNAK